MTTKTELLIRRKGLVCSRICTLPGVARACVGQFWGLLTMNERGPALPDVSYTTIHSLGLEE